MALTYRTGSGGKGSALTIEELDNNFRYFTGSHSVTGSFGVSGSITLTGSLDIDGSVEATNFSGSSFTGSFVGDGSGLINLPTSDPFPFDGNAEIVGNLDVTGSVNINKDGGDILTINDIDMNISTKFDSDGIGGDNSFWQSFDGTNYNHVIGTQFNNPDKNLLIGYQGVTKTIINAQTGNVGIGTETPFQNTKLDVNGAVKIGEGNFGYVIISDDYLGGELGLIDDRDEIIAARFDDGSYRYGGGYNGDEPLNISQSMVRVNGSLNFIGGVDSTLLASNGLQEIELSVVDANNGNSPDNLRIALNNQGEGYFLTKILALGDEEGVYNNTLLTINAQTNKFEFQEGDIQIDGDVGIGTSTPTSKLQVVGLAEHADNAAALVAGLTIGAFYRTGDLLKVVH